MIREGFVSESESRELIRILRPLRDYKSGGRWRAAMSDGDLALLGSKRKSTSRVWHPLVRDLKDRLGKHLNVKFNFTLINHYDSGKEAINFHSDNLRNSEHGTVASISLGETRTFRWRHKLTGEEHEVQLRNGDLFVFDATWNERFWHGIPREKDKGYRCNLTFRCVAPRVRKTGAHKLFDVTDAEFKTICSEYGVEFVAPADLRPGDVALKRWGNAGKLEPITRTNITSYQRGRESKDKFDTSDLFIRCPRRTRTRIKSVTCPLMKWYFPQGPMFTPTVITHHQVAGMLRASELRCAYEVVSASPLDHPIAVSANGASPFIRGAHGDLDGLKMHYPYSRYLFGGQGAYTGYPVKRLETRTHVRFDLSGRTMAIVETQGPTRYGRRHITGKGARVIGVVTFGPHRRVYGVAAHFAADAHAHLVGVNTLDGFVYDEEQCAWLCAEH